MIKIYLYNKYLLYYENNQHYKNIIFRFTKACHAPKGCCTPIQGCCASGQYSIIMKKILETQVFFKFLYIYYYNNHCHKGLHLKVFITIHSSKYVALMCNIDLITLIFTSIKGVAE